MTDDLTGIPNRYSFDQSLSRAFERAFHSKNTLGVEIIDVDGFKEYNDNFGHQAGDECLEIIGEILKEFSEKEDIFCARYGGDEFVIIYEGKSDDEIKEIASQIGEAIRYPVTISQGVCNDIPVAKAKPWDFLSEADEALYSVKGKDGNDIPIRKLSKYR